MQNKEGLMPATIAVMDQDLNVDLQVLVKELSKTNPDLKLIQSKTAVLGIPYSSDLIVLMSEILVYLSKSKGTL